jgi:hypothetical protein
LRESVEVTERIGAHQHRSHLILRCLNRTEGCGKGSGRAAGRACARGVSCHRASQPEAGPFCRR